MLETKSQKPISDLPNVRKSILVNEYILHLVEQKATKEGRSFNNALNQLLHEALNIDTSAPVPESFTPKEVQA